MKEVIITSSVLILALLILRAIFARKVRRTLIYGTWLLVALRLLLPLQIGNLSISVLNSFRPVTDAITDISQKQVAGVTEQDAYRQVLEDYIEKDQTVFTPQVQEQINTELDKQVPKEEIATMIDKVYSDQEVYVPEVRPQVQQQVADTANPVTLGVIVGTLWLLGAIVVALWLASGNLFFVRSLRKSAVPVDIDSPIPVYASEKAISPCLVGLFRPAVYVAPEVAENKALLHYVMTHELTHYAHRDHIWSAVRCLCLCLHWFNPLVWVAAFCSRRDCELACDEGALRRLGEDQRIPYGKALLEVVRETAVPNKLKFTATTMAESKRQLLQRVNFIARRPRWSLVAAITMLLICALVAGCVSTGAKNQTAANDPAVADPTYATEATAPTKPTTEPTIAPTTVPTNPTTAPTQPSAPEATEPPKASSGLFYKTTSNNTCTITSLGVCQDLDVVIPETIDGYTVTAIDDNAFKNHEKLQTIILPDSVTKIGSYAFFGCSKLTEIRLSRNITAIPYQAFAESGLKRITIPEGVTVITRYAFVNCHQLKEIQLPDSLTEIGDYAFALCLQLESIQLPDGLTELSWNTFMNCDKLTEVRIPYGETMLGDNLFYACNSLKRVYIPTSITTIRPNVFDGCPAMESVYYSGTLAQWDAINKVDKWVYKPLTVHCTDGTVSVK